MNSASIRRLYPAVIGGVVLTGLVVFLVAGISLNSILNSGAEAELGRWSGLVAGLVSGNSDYDPLGPGFDERIKALAPEDGSLRLTVVDRGGRVLADSSSVPAEMENHADRPEIAGAFSGRVSMSSRPSATLGRRMLYVAGPVGHGPDVFYVVRAARPSADLLAILVSGLASVAAAMALIATGSAWLLYRAGRRVTDKIQGLCEAADRFSAGVLDFRVPLEGPLELVRLAQGMNEMAENLAARLIELEDRGLELHSILSDMHEPLILADRSLSIRLCNRAALELFGIPRDDSLPEGTSLSELTRSSVIVDLADRVVKSSAALDETVTLYRENPHILQGNFAPFRSGGSDRPEGVLIVLNDITRISRLETIRRDFVANVSHELRTPITSIKGFLETLKDGALERPKDALRFLDIIEKQSERLEAIIEDMLSLARLEQGERTGIQKERSKIKAVLESAVQNCERRARGRKMKVAVGCEKDLTANVNANLLEQAVTNLVDNALKFSPKGTGVEVSAGIENGLLVVRVADQGKGIPAADLPRLFERFYVIDKARSREMGGTGLGLAIVKHIALVHGGTVDVESWENSGSVFSIKLPK